MMKPKIIFTIDGGMMGERYSQQIDLAEDIAREIMKIDPPINPSSVFPLDSFETVVTAIRTREYRKDLFQRECHRLGTLLAERMEDAEGWHDTSRIEPAKRSLNTR